MQRLACLLLVLFIVAQGGVPTEAAMENMLTLQQSIAASDNQFGLNLFKAVATKSRKANVLVSPLSIAIALQMTVNGAVGQTKAEMLQALKLSDRSLDDINNANADLISNLTADQSNQTFDIANALFVQNGIKLQPSMQAAMNKIYQAKVENVDFRSHAAVETINAFVNEATHGKIPTILQASNPLMRLVLVNALYFKGKWVVPFEKSATHDQTFHAASGDTSVPMMHRQGEMAYFEDASMQAVGLPYAGKRTRMVVILPASGEEVSAFESNLTVDKLNAALSHLWDRQGTLAVPKFKIEWEGGLKGDLESLGMKTPFGAADFSNLMETNEKLQISEVLHKTFMDFNEEGTEAAAATAVIVAARAARMPSRPFNMVVDRPFLIALQDVPTGAIIFLGRISNPKAEASKK